MSVKVFIKMTSYTRESCVVGIFYEIRYSMGTIYTKNHLYNDWMISTKW